MKHESYIIYCIWSHAESQVMGGAMIKEERGDHAHIPPESRDIYDLLSEKARAIDELMELFQTDVHLVA